MDAPMNLSSGLAEPPGTPGGHGWGLDVWLVRGDALLKNPGVLALVLLVFMVLVALHRPDGVTNPQLWAEDGPVFHQDAEQFGFRSLFIPRMGYFHTIPRLIALAARPFDPAWTPAIYSYSALFISGLVATRLISPRAPGGRLTGLGLGLLLVVSPNYSNEIFLAPTNIQWLVIPFLTGLLLRAPPPTTGCAVAEALACFVVGTTTPLSIVVAPLAGVWAVWRRERRRLIVVAGLVLAALLQAGALLLTSQPPRGGNQQLTLGFVAQVLGLRVFAEGLLPQIPCDAGLVRAGMGWVTFAGLGLVGLLPGGYWPARLLLVTVTLASLGATLARGWSTGVASALLDSGFDDRYFYAIRVQFLWCVLLAGVDAWTGRPWLAIGCGFLLGLGVVSALRTYRVGTLPDMRWGDYVPALREGRPVDIPLNPSWTYHYPGRQPHPGAK